VLRSKKEKILSLSLHWGCPSGGGRGRKRLLGRILSRVSRASPGEKGGRVRDPKNFRDEGKRRCWRRGRVVRKEAGGEAKENRGRR
jgi:hypothetical protein